MRFEGLNQDPRAEEVQQGIERARCRICEVEKLQRFLAGAGPDELTFEVNDATVPALEMVWSRVTRAQARVPVPHKG